MKIDNNPFAKGFREKDGSGSNGSIYSSPQNSPQSYIPLRMPFCHRPLWITPLGQDKQQSEAELEVAEGSSSAKPLPPMQPYPLQPCCWPWPSYLITPKQEEDPTVTASPLFCHMPVPNSGVAYGYSNQAYSDT